MPASPRLLRRLVQPAPFVPLARARRPGVPNDIRRDPGHRVLPLRLERLVAALDRLLEDPVRVVTAPGVRTAWVFGTIGYRVCARRRTVTPMLRADGVEAPMPWRVELARPLCAPDFLARLACVLGLSDAGPQQHLFVGEGEAGRQLRWLAAAAYRMVSADERFVRLRRQLLPSALALDPEVMHLARRARVLPYGAVVSAAGYTHAWQQSDALARVQRENPQLLASCALALAERVIAPGGDAVHALHQALRRDGFSAAAWRWLARHGDRALRHAWCAGRPYERFAAGLALLRCVERARCPAPPPPAAAEHIAAAIVDELLFRDDDAPWPWAFACALREADRLRGAPEMRGFLEELRVVGTWPGAEPERGQRRAGWRWLVRRALETQARASGSVAAPLAWHSAIGAHPAGGYRLVPLESAAALVEEALAMHNCLASFAGDCRRGKTRFFSVREPGGRRRVATIGLVVLEGRWAVLDAKGPVNAEAPADVLELAARLAARYAEVAGVPAPPPEGVAPEPLMCLEAVGAGLRALERPL